MNSPSQNSEHAVDLTQTAAMLWASRQYILIIASVVFMFGAFKAITATRIYEASALVQVEDENKSISDSVGGGI